MKLAFLLLALVISAFCEEQQACGERVRRSWRSLDRTQKQLVVDAFDALKRNGEWDQFADMHNDPANRDYAHGRPGFFVWHRHYLFGFENAIRALGGRFACFNLPYWPFEMDAGREAQSAVFDFFGYPTETNGQCVVKAPFNRWRAFDGPCIRRTYQNGFSFVGEARCVELIVNTQNYGLQTGFRSLIEGSPHAGVHNYLGGGGGHMGTMASPNDPLFFLLHCNVDRIFTIWYDCRDYENGRFTSGAWPDASGRQPMPFIYRGQPHHRFPRSVSPIDSYNLNTELHPYRYDENDRLVGLIESTAGSASRCRFNLFNGETSKKRALQELEEEQQQNYRPQQNNAQPNQTVKFYHDAVQQAYDNICTHEIPDAPKMYQIHATAMAECNICTGGGRRKHATNEWIAMSHMQAEAAVFEPICGKHNQQQQPGQQQQGQQQYQDPAQQQYQDPAQQQYQDPAQQQYDDQQQYAPIQVGQYRP